MTNWTRTSREEAHFPVLLVTLSPPQYRCQARCLSCHFSSSSFPHSNRNRRPITHSRHIHTHALIDTYTAHRLHHQETTKSTCSALHVCSFRSRGAPWPPWLRSRLSERAFPPTPSTHPPPDRLEHRTSLALSCCSQLVCPNPASGCASFSDRVRSFAPLHL